MTNKLLNCPFCDSKAYNASGYKSGKVSCDNDNCPICMIAYFTPEEWNTRTQIPYNEALEKVARAIRDSAYNFKRTIPVKTPTGIIMVDENQMTYDDMGKAALAAIGIEEGK